MEIFINESSLNNQFENDYSFLESIKIFLRCIKILGELKRQTNILKSDSFFYYSGIKGTCLETILKRNPVVNSVFVQNWQSVNPKSWEIDQAHDTNSNYVYSARDYVRTSVAEIAERKLRSDEFIGFLLNFSNSQFGESFQIDILKNNKQKIFVNCQFESDSIYEWLISNNIVQDDDKYDENSDLSPRDNQTVLNDDKIFEKTDYPRNNGRVVYRKKGTSQLWVVDSSPRHKGVGSHIEVFDENSKKHLGTSLYKEINIKDKHKDPNRYINLG